MLDKLSSPNSGWPNRASALAQRLSDEVDLARIAPGKAIPLSELARRISCPESELPSVLAGFVSDGLISIVGDSCLVTPMDRKRLVLIFDRRVALELSIVDAAALRRGTLDEQSFAEAMAYLTRCALVGDIEGYGIADRSVDAELAAAAGMPDTAAELMAMKREFRRAWCAYNRLRDLNVPARLRQEIADAVVAGDPGRARTATEKFHDYLRHAY